MKSWPTPLHHNLAPQSLEQGTGHGRVKQWTRAKAPKHLAVRAGPNRQDSAKQAAEGGKGPGQAYKVKATLTQKGN